MKKILIFLLYLLPILTQAQVNSITVRSQIANDIPNNSARTVTPTKIRSSMNGIVDLVDTKLINVSTEAQLIAATTSNFANYDGSSWQKMAGNVASNGDDIINVSTTIYWKRVSLNTIKTKELANLKLHNIFTKAQLIAFTDSEKANFDGSEWERKAGNVASNGGAFAGTIINVSASFYWERKFENVVNVKWFGAKGDNITDDFTAITSAINYCTLVNTGSGIVLYFPGGTYLISAKILMPNRVGFQGANGRGTVIKPHSTFAGTYMFHSVNGTTSMFGSYLKDFYIDARGKNMTSVVYSEAWQESCGMERVVIQFNGTTVNGFEYSNGYGGAAYLPLKDCEIFSESTNVNAKGIKINQVSSVGGFILSVEGTTIAGSVANPLPVGIYMANDALIIKGYHVEYVVSGIKVAGLSSLSADTYTGSFNATTNLVEIETGFTGTMNLKNMIPNGTTSYILKDNINSRHIASSEGNVDSYTHLGSSFSSNVTADITGQTGDGTEVTIVFGTEFYDYKSEYSQTTGIFTAKKAGKYLFNLTVQINLPAGSTGILLYVNTTQGNTELIRGDASLLRDGSNNVIFSGSALMDMAQNDFAKVILNVSGIGAKTVTVKATKSKFLGSFLYR